MNYKRPCVVIYLVATTVILNLCVLALLSIYHYFSIGHQRLDPTGVEFIVSKNLKPETDKLHIVVAGDSRAKHWAHYLNETPSVYYTNLGIAGQTSTQVKYRLKTQLTELNPNIVLIQVGINDIQQIWASKSSYDEIIDLIKRNIQNMISVSTERCDQVIISTVFPRADTPVWRKFFWNKKMDIAILEVNEFISNIAQENVFVFDAYSVLVDERGLINEKYSVDFLHLNKYGYAALGMDLYLRNSVLDSRQKLL